MSAPDNGLIRIVGVEVQAAPGKNPGEDIAWGRDALSRGPPNGYREGMFHTSPLHSSRDMTAVMMPRVLRSTARTKAAGPRPAGDRRQNLSEAAIPSRDEKTGSSVCPVWLVGKPPFCPVAAPVCMSGESSSRSDRSSDIQRPGPSAEKNTTHKIGFWRVNPTCSRPIFTGNARPVDLRQSGHKSHSGKSSGAGRSTGHPNIGNRRMWRLEKVRFRKKVLRRNRARL